MTFDERIAATELMDIYGELLTDKQQSVMQKYLYEDCSLFEIAEIEGVTRQAVRDMIGKSLAKMAELDSVLKIRNSSFKTREAIDKASKSALRLSDCSEKTEILAALETLSSIWRA